jgi:4-diphosphocytidyl-2-C-methyl-D-erythritol kinase
MRSLSFFAPAKLNLFLAITGRRPDGFHDLISVVVTTAFGDTLQVEAGLASGGFSLTCDDPTVPLDGSNLIVKAAAAWAKAFGEKGGAAPAARFTLEKRIPMGAGLGGGSSDAVATLRALEALSSTAQPLDPTRLAELAAGLGSDCPLFLAGEPVVMRGRGECITPLDAAAARRLRGRRVLIFKPGFGIATPWAYRRMAADPATYLPAPEAEARLADWINGSDPAESLLFNNMESVAFTKFIALPTLLSELRSRYGLVARMSGSGSACFTFLAEDTPVDEVVATIRTAWGSTTFITDTRIT